LNQDLLTLVSDVARHMPPMATAWPKPIGITLTQLIIPRATREGAGPVSMRAWRRIAEVSPISIARLIDRLEALAWSNAAPDPVRSTNVAAAADVKGRGPLQKELNRV